MKVGQIIKKNLDKNHKHKGYVKDNNNEDEKAKVTKKFVMKHYKKRLKASQIENITNYLEKKEIDAEI